MKFREFLLNEAEYTVQPKTKAELAKIIKKTIKEKGDKCDLNFIDTSKITDMSYLFEESDFNGDISKWNVSNVEDMNFMFGKSNFSGDISKWNVSNVKNMSNMFVGSPLEGKKPSWYR